MKPRALIVGDRRKDGVREGVRRARPFLESRLEVVDVDLEQRLDLAKASADLVLVFGGDGSFLYVAERLGTNPIPVLGVNFGRLGYLAELQPEELEAGIDAYVAGRFRVTERSRLACTHVVGMRRREAGLALNDVVVGRRVLGRMVEVEVRIEGRDAIHLAGDGLIVATATGSTAHALSAGGPIVEPSIPAMVLVPICPHALGVRPLLVPLSATVELRVRADHDAAVVTLDGREPVPLAEADTIQIRDARAPLRVISVSGRSYSDLLRLKLGFKGRPNYRGLSGDSLDGDAPVVPAPSPVAPAKAAPRKGHRRKGAKRA